MFPHQQGAPHPRGPVGFMSGKSQQHLHLEANRPSGGHGRGSNTCSFSAARTPGGSWLGSLPGGGAGAGLLPVAPLRPGGSRDLADAPPAFPPGPSRLWSWGLRAGGLCDWLNLCSYCFRAMWVPAPSGNVGFGSRFLLTGSRRLPGLTAGQVLWVAQRILLPRPARRPPRWRVSKVSLLGPRHGTGGTWLRPNHQVPGQPASPSPPASGSQALRQDGNGQGTRGPVFPLL